MRLNRIRIIFRIIVYYSGGSGRKLKLKLASYRATSTRSNLLINSLLIVVGQLPLSRATLSFPRLEVSNSIHRESHSCGTRADCNPDKKRLSAGIGFEDDNSRRNGTKSRSIPAIPRPRSLGSGGFVNILTVRGCLVPERCSFSQALTSGDVRESRRERKSKRRQRKRRARKREKGEVARTSGRQKETVDRARRSTRATSDSKYRGSEDWLA